MERSNIITSTLLSIASFIVSCVFVFYGTGILLSEEVPKWIIAFAIVAAAYGFSSLAILIMAWRRYGTRAKIIISYLAIGFMVVFVFGSLDVGMVSGLEVAGLLLVGVMLFINWLAVSTVVKWRSVA